MCSFSVNTEILTLPAPIYWALRTDYTELTTLSLGLNWHRKRWCTATHWGTGLHWPLTTLISVFSETLMHRCWFQLTALYIQNMITSSDWKIWIDIKFWLNKSISIWSFLFFRISNFIQGELRSANKGGVFFLSRSKIRHAFASLFYPLLFYRLRSLYFWSLIKSLVPFKFYWFNEKVNFITVSIVFSIFAFD